MQAGNLKYQVQIVARAQPRGRRRQRVPRGRRPARRARLDADEEWFGVFVRVENTTDDAARVADEFKIVDTAGNEYEPIPIGDANPFTYRRASSSRRAATASRSSPTPTARRAPVRSRARCSSSSSRARSTRTRRPSSRSRPPRAARRPSWSWTSSRTRTAVQFAAPSFARPGHPPGRSAVQPVGLCSPATSTSRAAGAATSPPAPASTSSTPTAIRGFARARRRRTRRRCRACRRSRWSGASGPSVGRDGVCAARRCRSCRRPRRRGSPPPRRCRRRRPPSITRRDLVRDRRRRDAAARGLAPARSVGTAARRRRRSSPRRAPSAAPSPARGPGRSRSSRPRGRRRSRRRRDRARRRAGDARIGALKPKPRRRATSRSGPSLAPSGAKTELHECANDATQRAAARLAVGVLELDALERRQRLRPDTSVSGFAMPASSAPASVMILNVEPGGCRPEKASPASARISPVAGRSAATPPSGSPSAATAARWTLRVDRRAHRRRPGAAACSREHARAGAQRRRRACPRSSLVEDALEARDADLRVVGVRRARAARRRARRGIGPSCADDRVATSPDRRSVRSAPSASGVPSRARSARALAAAASARASRSPRRTPGKARCGATRRARRRPSPPTRQRAASRGPCRRRACGRSSGPARRRRRGVAGRAGDDRSASRSWPPRGSAAAKSGQRARASRASSVSSAYIARVVAARPRGREALGRVALGAAGAAAEASRPIASASTATTATPAAVGAEQGDARRSTSAANTRRRSSRTIPAMPHAAERMTRRRRPLRSSAPSTLDCIIVPSRSCFALVGFAAAGSSSARCRWPASSVGAWLGTRFGPLLLPDGIALAVRAAVRAARRAARRDDPRRPGWRASAGALRVGDPLAGPRRARRAARRAAERRARARPRVDRRRGRAADARRARAARAHPAVGDPRRAQRRRCRRRTRCSTRSRASTRSRSIDGPERRRRAAAPAVARDPDVRAAGAARRARSSATACGLGVEGSGWVAGDGLVVTNAHVVAGQDDTIVAAAGGGGPRSTRRAIAFDPRNDIAVLRVPRARRCRALRSRATAPRWHEPGAILGYPLNGPFDVRAGAHRRRRAPCSRRTPTAAGRCDAGSRRSAGACAAGNSGGPIVDARRAGARRRSSRRRSAAGRRGGYAVPNAIVRAALAARPRRPVDTGPCARLTRPGAVADGATLPVPDAQDPRHRREAVRRPRPRARAARARSRSSEGYLEGPEHVLTWAVGHLVQLAEPDEYDDEVQEVAHGRPADRAGEVQARRARRALARSRCRSSSSSSAATTSTSSSTPATPAARAS